MPANESTHKPLIFGRYTTKKVLGKGAMGTVYLAEDPLIGREIALKVIRAQDGLTDADRADRQARFEREFRSAGAMSHPNIVMVLDAAQEGEDSYLAMEYVRGEPLDARIASGRYYSFKEIADISLQLGAALDYAHERGVVHRDVKPANVLMDRDGRAKLTDFGVAKLANMTLTKAGTVIGTPAYMSPEQITSKNVTAASDQFSLACILYELLTGERPFSGDSPTTIMYKIVHEAPIGAAEINRELPPAIDQVLLRALQKNPKERYPNCTALAEAVREALGAAPPDMMMTVVSGATAQEPSRSSRHRVWAIVGLAAILVLAYAGWMWLGSEPEAAGPGTRDAGGIAAPAESPVDTQPDSGTANTATDSPAAPAEPVEGGDEPSSDLTTSPEPATSTASVALGASPEGAEVWVDGEDTGLRTPAALQLQGPEGRSWHVELRRDGQVLGERDFVLDETLPERWVLEPITATFSVTSEPAGAHLFVGGHETSSVTPTQIELDMSSTSTLRLELAGYKSISWPFRPEGLSEQQQQSKTLHFPMVPDAPPGVIEIAAPYSFQVQVDRKDYGSAANHEIALPAGDYAITVDAPDVFLHIATRVQLESGGRTPIPVPDAVAVTVAATPSDCRVTIDGIAAGETPLVDRSIVVGTHEFVFRWIASGKTVTKMISIRRPGQRIFEVEPGT